MTAIDDVALRTCIHLVVAGDTEPRTQGCEECLAAGDPWKHLRLCLQCGHVGCCNESKNAHAARHFAETGHPVIRSFEPGEDWEWCYVDSIFLQGGHAVIGKEYLSRLPIFKDLNADDLDRLFKLTELTCVPAGEIIMREGDPGDSMCVVLKGALEVTTRREDREVFLARRVEGEVIGEMALLEDAPRSATVRTTEETHLLVISRAAFNTLLECSPSAPLAMLDTMISRLRSNNALLMQQEKLAGLGTMAAGLAHELNNPAGAIQRAADQLGEALETWERDALALGDLSLQPGVLDEVRALEREASADQVDLSDPLARSDREDTITDWLEDRAIARSWEIAPVLAGAGWTEETLDRLEGVVPEDARAAVVAWLASRGTAQELLSETRTSASMISELVKSIKSYSRLDEAEIVEVDIRASLENTLVMLKHKLRGGIDVVREYAPDLPKIEGYGSELNQVWTNIIDNAIDAMDGKGKIVIRTERLNDYVAVEIADNGPGIPPHVQGRIFEPFFTTKDVGAGSGQGLHIAHSIVVNRQKGSIEVQTGPEGTTFRIELPVVLKKTA